jgi:hypothetical protein
MDILLNEETRLLHFLPFEDLRLLPHFHSFIIPLSKLPGSDFLNLGRMVPLHSVHKLLVMDLISRLPDLVHHMQVLLF